MKRFRWSVAVLLACPCLGCRSGDPSETASSAKGAKQEPERAPQPEDVSIAHEQLASALTKLAAEPSLLGEEPERIHTELGLDQAFYVYRYSKGVDETERVGFSIRPHHTTKVLASDFAKAMGLETAAHLQLPLADGNRERLADAGKTPFSWKGLELEIELRQHDWYLGLRGWSILDVVVLPPAPPQWIEAPQLTIAPDEAAAAGLPALGFSVTLDGTGMTGAKLRDGDYLRVSGPPGGPLLLRIGPATVGAKLEQVISPEHLGDAKLVEERVEQRNVERRAAAWVRGESMARTSWCAMIVGPVDGKPDDPALVVELGVGYSGDAVACATAIDDPRMFPVMTTLRLTSP